MGRYICIDLKSFYASVECIERGLDPLTTNLVVADASRTEKTICLAVTPSLKSYGVPGRARLFEVIQKVREINSERLSKAPKRRFTGKSFSDTALKKDSSLELDYLIASPRMAHYMYFSTQIYKIYLKYVAPEDIHVYSIDEVFMDVTHYTDNGLTAKEFARQIISDVLKTTGITATVGIGTNMYLAKVAMDIVAKKIPADENGVRIAELDEMSYRYQLWDHRPLTDFWRVGKGIARRLESNGLYTMGDIALCSHYYEDRLYSIFGKNAELLIDHAWGWEPCTIAEVKAYKPQSNSISSGQVLSCPYTVPKARIIVGEMIDQLALDLLRKGVVTSQIVLDIGYDAESLTDPKIFDLYNGEISVDHYGRAVPKHAHGTANLSEPTSSSRLLSEAVLGLYDKIIHSMLLVRRITLAACNVLSEAEIPEPPGQLSLFEDSEAVENIRKEKELSQEREKRIQEAVLGIKDRYGKNAIVKGMNLCDGATAISRNSQIGGHKA